MTKNDLEIVSEEIDRLLRYMGDLNTVTISANIFKDKKWNEMNNSIKEQYEFHHKMFGYDYGLHSTCQSKRRAAVKRAALNLRYELLRLTR